MLDIHCANILMEFYAGKITREEALRRIALHEDMLIRARFESAFTCSYTIA